MNKTCSSCQLSKDTVEFSKNRTRRDGLAGMCKACIELCRGKRVGSIKRCERCGEDFFAECHRRKVCSLSCCRSERDQNGENNPSWKGGTTVSTKGYVYVLMPDHHLAMPNGYVKRANVVMEQKIGRPMMRGEQAHHINRIKTDDSPDNLELHTASSHGKLHAKERRAAVLNSP